MVLKSKNQTKLGCLIIPSTYLEEFSYPHPPIEGFSDKIISTPNPLDFPETTSPGSKTFWKSNAQPSVNPITPWLSGNGKATLKPLSNLTKPISTTKNEPNTHTHVPCMPKLA